MHAVSSTSDEVCGVCVCVWGFINLWCRVFGIKVWRDSSQTQPSAPDVSHHTTIIAKEALELGVSRVLPSANNVPYQVYS